MESMEQGEVEGAREDAGPRPEDEPGSGVVTAFGRQLKLLRVRAGLERPTAGQMQVTWRTYTHSCRGTMR